MKEDSISQVVAELRDRSFSLEDRAGMAILVIKNSLDTQSEQIMRKDTGGKFKRVGKMRIIGTSDYVIAIKQTEKNNPLQDAHNHLHSMMDFRGLYVCVFDPGVYPDDVIGNEEAALGLVNNDKGGWSKVSPVVGLTLDTFDLDNIRLRGYIQRGEAKTVKSSGENGKSEKKVYLPYKATLLRKNSPMTSNHDFRVGYELLIETAEKVYAALNGPIN